MAVSADDQARVYFGLGYDDIFDRRTPSAATGIEYISPGFGPGGNYFFQVAGMATADIDLWVGAGLGWGRPIRGGPWFFELSVAPGIFYRKDEEPGTDNLHFPMFRTQGVIGYELSNDRSLSVALSHHSAARIDSDAGDTNTIWIRYGMKF